jgi:hypothetical protein
MAAGRAAIDRAVPLPSGADIIMTQREAGNDAWDLPKAATMDAFVERHPQWAAYMPSSKFQAESGLNWLGLNGSSARWGSGSRLSRRWLHPRHRGQRELATLRRELDVILVEGATDVPTLDQVVGGTVDQLLVTSQQPQPISELEGQFQVMAGQHDETTRRARMAPKPRHHAHPAGQIREGRDLVEQQHLRALRQCPRQRSTRDSWYEAAAGPPR